MNIFITEDGLYVNLDQMIDFRDNTLYMTHNRFAKLSDKESDRLREILAQYRIILLSSVYDMD